MADQLRRELQKGVDWYEPRPPDPSDAARRTRIRTRRGKAAVMAVAFVLGASTISLVIVAFSNREGASVDKSSSLEALNDINTQLHDLEAKIAAFYTKAQANATRVNALSEAYREAISDLLSKGHPSERLRRTVEKLRSELADQHARMDRIVADMSALLNEVKMVVARLAAAT